MAAIMQDHDTNCNKIMRSEINIHTALLQSNSFVNSFPFPQDFLLQDPLWLLVHFYLINLLKEILS